MTTARKPAPREEDPYNSPLLYDRDTEIGIVAATLMRTARARLVCDMVRPEHFKHPACREAIEVVTGMISRNEDVDLMSVNAEIRRLSLKGRSFVVTGSELAGMLDGRAFVSDESITRACTTVLRTWQRRELMSALRDAHTMLLSEPDIDAARGRVYSALDAGVQLVSSVEDDSYESLMTDLYVAMESGDLARDRMSTGIPALDASIEGFGRGWLVLIGARTNVGKTALATSMATAMASLDEPLKVSMINVEMGRREIAQRYVGAITDISLRDMRTGNLHDVERERMHEAMMRQLPICTASDAKTWQQIRARISQHRRKLGGLDVVFIDYLQLVKIQKQRDETRYEALGRLSSDLKELAKELQVCVIACCQLNRMTEDRPGPPRVSDLRESGNLEQDADLVLLLYRDKQKGKGESRYVYLEAGKNRHGPKGRVALDYHASATKFVEAEGDDEE